MEKKHFSSLVPGSFPILPTAYPLCLFPVFHLSVSIFLPFSMSNSPKKKLKKRNYLYLKLNLDSPNQLPCTCKLIVLCLPNEGYTISKTINPLRDTHILTWNTIQHLLFSHKSVLRHFPALLKQVHQKVKCSTEKQISRYMYVAILFWVKNVKIGKSYISHHI